MKSLILIFLFIFSQMSVAETVFLPDSRHQQFLTYGLYIDQQSTLLVRDSKRAWASIAANFALVEQPDWVGKPQLILSGSANTAFHVQQYFGTLFTETIDARVGLAMDWAKADALRFSFGWQHQSGHISDNVADADLIGSNLGNEILFARLIYDCADHWRLGGTLKPYVSTDPAMKWFAADQFIEWFPWGAQTDFRNPTPYIAASMEEYGSQFVDFSWNSALGIYFGNHLNPVHHTALRAVLGYYQGVDPRLKYVQYKHSRMHFSYAGLIFDL